MKHSASLIYGVFCSILSASIAVSSYAQTDAPRRPAIPIEPIAAVLDAFRSHDIVALGEGAHGNEQGHAFRLSLLRDARFATTVNDIVVECGNARYQDVMDRFVRGDAVPDDALRQTWQSTTAANAACDVPIYEEFYRAVRVVNTSLPTQRQLRVILGDPPVNWDSVHSAEDLRQWTVNGNRNRHPADLIRREVLAKNRRALIIYGDGHIWRKALAPTLVGRIEADDGASVFAIGTPTGTDLATLQTDIASWPKPSIAILRGTILGAKSFPSYYPDGLGTATEQFNSLRMEDQSDAVLYLGPPSSITFARLSPKLCEDDTYMEMRLRRMAVMPVGAQDSIDRLKRYCATVVKK
jgi:hypothetical protein